MSMEHSWFVTRKVVTMTTHFQVCALCSTFCHDSFVWWKLIGQNWVFFSISSASGFVIFIHHVCVCVCIKFFSAWRRHGQTLSHSSVGRGWILHCTSHNIQVTYFCSVFFSSNNPEQEFKSNRMLWIANYRTLQELVEHYSKDSDGLCVNLRSACVQVHSPFRFSFTMFPFHTMTLNSIYMWSE